MNIYKQLNNISIFILISILININSVKCQDSEETKAIGDGVIIIIVGIAISFVICLLSNSTAYPEFVSLGGMLIPLFLFLLFYLVPKKSEIEETEDEESESDYFTPLAYAIQGWLIIGGIICLLWLFKFLIFDDRITRKPSNWYRDSDDLMLQRLKEQEKEREMFNIKKGDNDDLQQLQKEDIQNEGWQNKNINPESFNPDVSRKAGIEFREKQLKQTEKNKND